MKWVGDVSQNFQKNAPSPFGFSPKFLKKTQFFSNSRTSGSGFGETIHVNTCRECILYRKEGQQQIKFGGGGRGGDA